MLGAHSFGMELRWTETNGVRVSETVMPAGLELQEHAHAPGQICFVLEGEYREQTAEGTHDLGPGAVQFHLPNERHSNQFSIHGDVLALLVSIDPLRWIEIHAGRPVTATSAIAGVVSDIRIELMNGDDAARAALEGLALLLLSRVARLEAGVAVDEPEWLSQAVAQIEHNYALPLSLASVAASVGIHRTTLASAFRRFRSASVGEYIREVRIRHAMALLHGRTPLDEIAYTTGFSDQAHFGRVFKKATGLTPGQVRARSRRSA
jgi:AraC family transcriptional regulator